MRLRSSTGARWQQVPAGVRDLLPADAERRTLLAGRLREEFRRWGYREVATPTLEYLETFLREGGPGLQDQLFKIVDTGGELLALRPELTVPIARLAATRLADVRDGPLRLSYVAQVFRGQEGGQGRLREFTQAGVELIGASGPEGDAEVIALAVESLRAAGVRDAVLNVGHLGFVNDHLTALPEEAAEEIRTRLYRKAFVGIAEAAEEPRLARLLEALPDLHGADAVDRARTFAASSRSRAALDEVEAVLARVREYGADGTVGVDLSLIRDFGYYTGVVFEAYAPGAGFPLLGGGRYDGLLGRFGVDRPATGFALGVDRILGVAAGDAPPSGLLLVACDMEGRAAAMRLVAALRREGVAVIAAPGATWGAAQAQGTAQGASAAAYVSGGRVRFCALPSGQERTMAASDLPAYVAGRRDPEVELWSH